jgi:RHS repeat-associated protein
MYNPCVSNKNYTRLRQWLIAMVVLWITVGVSPASAAIDPIQTTPIHIVETGGSSVVTANNYYEAVPSVTHRTGSDTYLAAYADYNTSTDSYGIVTTNVDREGEAVGTPAVAVTATSGNWHFFPRVFSTRNGYLLTYITWNRTPDPDEYELHAVALDEDGAPISGAIDHLVHTWDEALSDGLRRYANIGAYDSKRNEVLLTWWDGSLQAQRLSAGGVPIGESLTIPLSGGSVQSVLYNDVDDQYLVAGLSSTCEGASIAAQVCGQLVTANEYTGLQLSTNKALTNIATGLVPNPFRNEYGEMRTNAVTWDAVHDQYAVVYNAFERERTDLTPTNNKIFGKRLNADLSPSLDENDDPIEWQVSHTARFDYYSTNPREIGVFTNSVAGQFVTRWRAYDSRQNLANPFQEIGAQETSTESGVSGSSDKLVSAASLSDNDNLDIFYDDVAFNADTNEALFAWHGIRAPDSRTPANVSLYSRATSFGFAVAYAPIRVDQGEAVEDDHSQLPNEQGNTIESYAPVSGRWPAGLTVDGDSGAITGTVAAFYQRVTTLTGYITVTRTDEAQITVPVSITVYPSEQDLAKAGPAMADASDTGDPVNAVTGAMYEQHQDLLVPGRGVSIQLARTYNSASPQDGPFGYGWSGLYGARLNTLPRENLDGSTTEVATVSDHDGKILQFERESNGDYTAPAHVYDQLEQETDNSWTLTRRNGVRWLFTSDGQLTEIVDRNGNSLQFGYTDGAMTSVTDALGRSISLEYNSRGRVSQINAPGDREYHYGYNSAGDLTTFEDATGATWTYEYDSHHRLTTVLTPGDTEHPRGERSFEYNSAGRVIAAEGYNGFQRLEYSYDPANKTTTIEDARGFESVYHYNAAGLVTEIEDPDGQSLHYAFDSHGNMTSSTDQRGKTTEYTYDSRGNRLTTRLPKPHDSDNASDRPLTTTTYGDYDQPITSTDPEDGEMTLSYDTNGNLLSSTDPANQTTTWEYNSYGQPITVEDANEHTVSLAYGSSGNGNGRVVARTDGRGKVTTFAYDAWGNVTQATDPLGNVTTMTYDNANRLLSTTLPETVASRTDVITNQYDPRGNLLSVTDPRGQGSTTTYDRNDLAIKSEDATGKETTMEYDSMGNLVATTDPAGNTATMEYSKQGWLTTTTAEDGSSEGRVTNITYNANGSVHTITDANGATTTYTYDNLGRRTGVTDADEQESHTTYDKRGLVTAQTNPLGHVTSYVYDVRGQRISTTDAEDHQWAWTYDAVGNLLTQTDANGDVQTTSYDENGQPITRAFTGSSEPSIATTYDDAGRPVVLTRGDRSLSYVYDEQGYIIAETSAKTGTGAYSRTISRSYDQAGRLVTTTLPGASAPVGYSYDNAGRLTGVTDAQGSTVSYSYDAAGRLTDTTFPGTGRSQTTSYNEAGEPATLELNLGLSGTRTIEYGYDKRGNVTSIDDTTGSVATAGTLQYDDLARLTAEEYVKTPASGPNTATLREYTYDAAGNRSELAKSTTSGTDPPVTSSVQYSYDDAERLLTAGTTTYSYDDNGQLQTTTDSATTPASVATYGFNRAGEITTEGGSSFEYDPLGRRVASTTGGTTTNTVFDGSAIAQRYTGSTLDAEYTRTPGGSLLSQYDPAVLVDPTNVVYTDLLGSPVALNNGLSTTWSGAYNAFGDLRENTGNAAFSYLGNTANPSGTTLDFNARSYDPELGRFLSVDPVEGSGGSPQTLNPYAYGENSPYTSPDPSGLISPGKLLSLLSHGTPVGAFAQEVVLALAFPDPVGDATVPYLASDECKPAELKAFVANAVGTSTSGRNCDQINHDPNGLLLLANGKNTSNASYAGGNHGKTGVPFTPEGFPRFNDSSVTPVSGITRVKIDMKGNYGSDFRKADNAAGINEDYRRDHNLTWHHVEDCSTMQLVNSKSGSAHFHTKHHGAVDLFKQGFCHE